jgi:hypothetical protein
MKTPQGSRQIGVHLRSELGRLQKRHSVFGREDDVHQYDCAMLLITLYFDVIVMSKSGPLSGRSLWGDVDPGLKPWAESLLSLRDRVASYENGSRESNAVDA